MGTAIAHTSLPFNATVRLYKKVARFVKQLKNFRFSQIRMSDAKVSATPRQGIRRTYFSQSRGRIK
ncbi:MAG: hypothetical protein LBO81_07570, partial [Clostridiales Family XIII bacterium]|nr:hypothetical protein [Clostridiales Family XIII bacterium]